MHGAPRLSLPSRERALPLLPGGVLLAVTIAWAFTSGGYESQPALGAGWEPSPWYLGALTLVGLACATAFGIGRARLSRASMCACAALGAYVGWSFLSVLWAHDQGAAFLGSDRALVYLAAFLTFALLPWGNWSGRAALALLVAGLGVAAILTAVRVATLADPSSLYLGERLAYPLGYYNADAVLFMGTAVAAIALGSRRREPIVLRVAGLAIAALCLQLAVLSQSRGWLFSVPVVLSLTLLLVPNRLRLLAFALPPALATAAVAPALLSVYGKATASTATLKQPHLSRILHTQGAHAVRAMLVAELVLAVLAAVMVAFDRHLRVGATTRQRINRAGATLALSAALTGIAIGLIAVHGDPIGRAERAWHSFADSGNQAGGYSHFTTLASNRADIWRVALDEFASHPLTGIGQDNFATSYARLRHSDEQPRWTHSIELRLLTHTGLVGALLFALFLLATLLAALRGRRGTHQRATAGILLLPLVVWLVQGSIDWFWEYPVLSVPALAFAGAAGALGRAPATPSRAIAERSRLLPIAGALCATLIAAAAVAAVAVPFVAAREVRKATLVWSTEPTLAYGELRSATKLLPFDAQLYLVGAAVALNLGEYPQARTWLLESERRDNQNWLTPFALGLVEGEAHRSAAARAQLRRALALNPREPAIAVALERAAGNRPLSFSEAQTLLRPHIVTPRA
jgi:O-antigen ligase/polysaccharide polymerase Wzy-like membrane protein